MPENSLYPWEQQDGGGSSDLMPWERQDSTVGLVSDLPGGGWNQLKASNQAMREDMDAADPLSAAYGHPLGAVTGMLGGAAIAGPALAPYALPIMGGVAGGRQGYKKAGVPGAIGGAALGAMSPPAGAAAGAMEGYEAFGVPGAVAGGIGMLGSVGKVAPVLKMLGKLIGYGDEVATAAAPMAQAVESIAPASGAVGKAAQVATSVPTASTVSPDVMRFAQEIIKSGNPAAQGFGAKIHILLDDVGKPIRWLTPDEAGAAARAGQATTWIRNIWGSP